MTLGLTLIPEQVHLEPPARRLLQVWDQDRECNPRWLVACRMFPDRLLANTVLVGRERARDLNSRRVSGNYTILIM